MKQANVTRCLPLVCWLCSCTTTPAAPPTPPAPTPEHIFLEQGDQEPLFVELDDHEAHASISSSFEKGVTLLQNKALQAYVARVGARVATHALPKHTKHRFSFKIIDAPETHNAVTLPGGHIYVYSGLLLALRDEAELASVLSHEVAHSVRHHGETTQALERVSQGGDGVMRGVDVLLPGVRDAARRGMLATFSREQEHEADRVAMVYLIRSGYAPEALPDFLERLGHTTSPPTSGVGMLMHAVTAPERWKELGRKMSQPGSAILSSHPHPRARAKLLRSLLVGFTSASGQAPVRQTDAFVSFHRDLLQHKTSPTQDDP